MGMADCKVCGRWFSSTAPDELCPTCGRALKQLNGYAVPVVRCKDCKHYYYSAYAMSCVCDFDNKEWDKDDFCSYGERREGE